MSSTRIRNDPVRIHKEMEIFTNDGRYVFNTPKWIDTNEYIEDPTIRIQKFEANKYNNRIDIENDIQGYTKPLTRDYMDRDQYKKYTPSPQPIQYNINSNTITDDSRATLPPFLFRDMEINRFESPFLNPQNRIEPEFIWNIDTRLIEKDRVFDNPPQANVMDSGYWLPTKI
jgi:hypothetical protein